MQRSTSHPNRELERQYLRNLLPACLARIHRTVSRTVFYWSNGGGNNVDPYRFLSFLLVALSRNICTISKVSRYHSVKGSDYVACIKNTFQSGRRVARIVPSSGTTTGELSRWLSSISLETRAGSRHLQRVNDKYNRKMPREKNTKINHTALQNSSQQMVQVSTGGRGVSSEMPVNRGRESRFPSLTTGIESQALFLAVLRP